MFYVSPLLPRTLAEETTAGRVLSGHGQRGTVQGWGGEGFVRRTVLHQCAWEGVLRVLSAKMMVSSATLWCPVVRGGFAEGVDSQK